MATVLASYMAGLALGAALAARLGARVRRPVLVYGVLEIGIALSALGVPFAIRGANALYVSWFATSGDQGLSEAAGAGLTAFYLLCSMGILIVPTTLMGATLPLLVRQTVRRVEEIGSRVGLLYAANTVGAVAGTLLAGFALLPRLGLGRTVWIAVAVNGAVFLAALALARFATPPLPALPRPPEAGWPRETAGRRRWILPIMALSGVASFTYEVLWTRLLGYVLGGSVYAFAAMLASFLVGIALGAVLASRVATGPARAARAFAGAQVGTGLLALAAFRLLDRLPALARALGAGMRPDLLSDVPTAMAVLLPSTLCIGATFPLAVRVLATTERDAASATASVYAWNTAGAILGAIGAGFLLVPRLGFVGTVTAASGLNFLLAGASWLLVPALRRRFLIAAAGAALVWLVLVPRQPPWLLLRSRPMTGEVARATPVFYGVGRGATVVLFRYLQGWSLETNGLIEAVIPRRGERQTGTELADWLTALPVLARPDAESLLLVGLGGGVALDPAPPSLRRIDVAELEPEVVAANRAVAAGREVDPLADPRVHVFLNDARAALLLATRRYDVIASQPSHPWTAGASHLYTREFFTLARSRLAEDGVLALWMGLAYVDVDLMRVLARTLLETFPHVRVYGPSEETSVLFLASAAPLDVERTAEEAIRRQPGFFAALGVEQAADVQARLLLDELQVRRFAGDAPVNRDDHNFLQTRSPHILGMSPDKRRAWAEVLVRFDPLATSEGAALDRARVVRQLARMDRADRAQRIAQATPDPSERRRLTLLVGATVADRESPALARAFDAAFADRPGDVELRAARIRLWRRSGRDDAPALPGPLRDVERRVVEATRRERKADWEGVRELDGALAAVDPADPLRREAAWLRVAWRAQVGDPGEAREALGILDVLLAPGALPEHLLLRARLARRAGDVDRVLASLRELGERPDVGPGDLRRGLDLASAVDPSAAGGLDQQVRNLLDRRLAAQSPPGRGRP